jgi:hypothetical protein
MEELPQNKTEDKRIEDEFRRAMSEGFEPNPGPLMPEPLEDEIPDQPMGKPSGDDERREAES